MKKVAFYNVDPIKPFVRSYKGLPENGDDGRWRFPDQDISTWNPTVSVMMDLPTDRIRLLGMMSQTEERGTLLATGPSKSLFLPDPGSKLAQTFGTDKPLSVDANEYMLDLEPIIVRPSDAWIENWLNPKLGLPRKVAHARRQMLSMLLGYTFEVRDTWNNGQHAFLQSFLRFTNPHHGDLTHSEHVPLLHVTSDLFVVSGPDPLTRFSMNDAHVQARRHFMKMAAEREDAAV